MIDLFIKHYGKYNTNYNGFDYINKLTNLKIHSNLEIILLNTTKTIL